MTQILHFFILVPLAGFILSLFFPSKSEKLISGTAFFTLGTQFIAFSFYLLYYLFNNHPTLNLKDIVLFKSSGYEFYIDFCFDKITAVYMAVGTFLTFMVTIYSRAYLHRETGYKRFFNTILFFYFGYVITVFSGNLETLFIGWEILGISSFLLIAFYRDRYLPVKNALKVFSIYRIGDVGLILAMWMSHNLWHENITFLQLNNKELVHAHLQNHSLIGVFIALMILITAAAKSAQLPFSSWLPRAMEGPTPSSAIFYGSLSVHLGVFLLLRTHTFWAEQYSIRILIGVLGLATSIITTGIARVQSSIKSQVAYSSIAQIGLIFIEIALGFENLALVHFAGNAFLRTYQLLVSPSVVTYLIREQFYTFEPQDHSVEDSIHQKIKYSLYLLCLKEWHLETFMYKMWRPFKRTGRKMNFLTVKLLFKLFIPSYIIGLVCLYYEKAIPSNIHAYLPVLFAFIGFVLVLKSYTERKSVKLGWVLIIMNHFWIALAISFNEHFKYTQSLLYLSGIIVAGVFGFLLLNNLKQKEPAVNLNRFQGYTLKYPSMSFIFLLCCLGLTGFPITPTFIGEDLIFSHIHENQIVLAFFVATSLIIDGISAVRIYARIFLGPFVPSKNQVNFTSSNLKF